VIDVGTGRRSINIEYYIISGFLLLPQGCGMACHNIHKLGYSVRPLGSSSSTAVGTGRCSINKKIHTIFQNRIKQADCFIDVPKLSSSDVTSILNGYLMSANRTLQDDQRVLLQDACKRCAIPLFLKLCVDQAVKWPSYENVDATSLQGSVKDVISKLFERLEKYHGYLLISHGLGYITAAKLGLR
jgi:hypothetical protein